jgi:magnesium transporter
MRSKVRRSVKTGLAPGSMIYVGDEAAEKVEIELIRYNVSDKDRLDLSDFDPELLSDERFTVNWLNICGVNNPKLIQELGKNLDIHVLTLEDILNTGQRPKIEDYGNYCYLVIKMLTYDETAKEIIHEQVSIILKDKLIVSFQEKEGDVFAPIRERINTDESRIRKNGVDYLLYALLDAVVDNYFVILEKIGDQVEDLEEGILTTPSPETMQQLYSLKRSVIMLRKNVWPLREVINFLQRAEENIIKQHTGIFLRDLYDHTIQVIDHIESLRDIISGMVDIYLTSISNRMNSVMKVLTIISTIFIPLTFIAGVYGMNFVFMPELQWPLSYPIVLFVMLVIVVVMLLFFKKKKWL